MPQGEQQIGSSIPVAPDCSISIMAVGQVTQGAIDNLVKYLQLFKGSFPEASTERGVEISPHPHPHPRVQ